MQASFVPSLLVECPKCGKYSIVQQEGTYQCLNCDFKKALQDSTVSETPSDHFLPMIFGVLTFVLVLMLFL